MMVSTSDDMRLGELQAGALYYSSCGWPRYSDYIAFTAWHGCILAAYVWSCHGTFLYGDKSGDLYSFLIIKGSDGEKTVEDACRHILKAAQKRDIEGSVEPVGRLFSFTTSDDLNAVYEKAPEDYVLTEVI